MSAPPQPTHTVQISVADAQQIARCVGPGGVFYPTDQFLDAGTVVAVEFIGPKSETISRITCRVRDSRMEIRGKTGMGLEVLALDPVSRAVLMQIATHSTREERTEARQWVENLDSYFTSDHEGPVIGIDLGTTNSCVAILEDGEPRVIRTPEGYETLPSIIYLSPDRRVLVGHKAREKMALEPRRAIYGSKRFIGRPYTAKEVATYGHFFRWDLAADQRGQVAARIDDVVVSLEVVAAAILKALKAMAEEDLGRPVYRAVITVPAYFGSNQRQAVRAAGRLAGLEVERVLNEPTAGAVAYGYGKGLSSTILVYDLGGGTFDASVLRIDGDRMEVLATDGGPFLGGSDFDDRISEYVLSAIQKEHGVDLRGDAIVSRRVRDAAENAKCQLSEVETTTIELPYLFTKGGAQQSVRMELGRDLVETLTRDLVDRTLLIVQSVLDAAKVRTDQLDDIIMIGGQSRGPIIRTMLADRFGRPPTRKVHPDHAVALGAAIVAAAADAKVNVELTDVLPSSIRVGTRDGGTAVVLPRGQPLPVFKEIAVDGPAVILYRGEATVAIDNEPLGAIDLSEISATGTPLVTVIVSADGTMTVSAEDPLTGEERELEISLLESGHVHRPSSTDSFFEG